LIGPDIYDQGTLFGDEERDRINAFDWYGSTGVPPVNVGAIHESPLPAAGAGAGFKSAPITDRRRGSQTRPYTGPATFGDIMRSGGFDCVIANPPYIRIQTLQEFSPPEASYLKAHYETAKSGNFDIYVCFVEKAFATLKPEGKLGFILPSKFFQTDYGAALRGIITRNHALEKVVDFSHLQVFEGPTTYTCLLFLTRDSKKTVEYVRVEDEEKLKSVDGASARIPSETLSSTPWAFSSRGERVVFEKMERGTIPLLDLATAISRGSSSGADDIFVVKKTEKAGVYVAKDGQTVRLEREIVRIPLYATDYSRYFFGPAAEERIIFPYRVEADSSLLLSESEFKTRFPRAYDYLRKRKRKLETRRQFAQWYGYSAPRNLSLHERGRMLVPLLADRGLFSEFPARQNEFCLMASGGFSIALDDAVQLSPRYLLGILNSKLVFAYLRSKSNIFRGGWITCTKQYVGPLPIRPISFSQPSDTARYDKMVALVERMLKLNKQKHSGRLPPSELDQVEREIATTDAEIDNLVYELYGITDEERKIIEGCTAGGAA